MYQSRITSHASSVTHTNHDAIYPERPVTLIVPWPAGGSTDVALRTLAEATSKHLGQRIVIENRPGAGTIGPAGWRETGRTAATS